MSLAQRLAGALDGEAVRCGAGMSLDEWTERHFVPGGQLVYVGAAGIAVRAIASRVRGKAEDPAVVVVDECGTYAVPILSGHLGGANALARRIAAVCGAEAVITTATDRNGVFPADEWARVQGCAVPFPERIKIVSARLLAGENITIRSDWPIAGEPPAGIVPVTEEGPADVRLTLRREDDGALIIVPRILVLGIGCRQGVGEDRIEAFFRRFMADAGLWTEGVFRVCSVDRKAEEPGILDFCAGRGLEYVTYPAGELAAVPGEFTASDYVLRITGTDNVCERSAVLGSGGGILLRRKTAEDGITLALAARAFRPDWRFQ